MPTDARSAASKAANLEKNFARLRSVLGKFSPPLKARKNEARYFDLWSEKVVDIDGRVHQGIFFAAVAIQKDYVGLYFMPVYTHEEAKGFISEELLALLKGKSCFHIRQLTPQLEKAVAAALRKGFSLYRARKWIGA